jgi:hypothetical protein
MSDAFYSDVPDEVLEAPAGKPIQPSREAPQNASTLLLIACLFPLAVLGFPAFGFLLLATGVASVGPPPDPSTLDLSGTQASLELPDRSVQLDLSQVALIRAGDRYQLTAQQLDGMNGLWLVCQAAEGGLAPGAALTVVEYDWLAGEPPTLELPDQNLVLLAKSGSLEVASVEGDLVTLELTGEVLYYSTERFADAQTGLRTRAATGAQAPQGGRTTAVSLTATARLAE